MCGAELMDIVEQYVDKFGDGPPIFEMDDDQAIAAMLEAIASGEALVDTAE